MEQYLEYQNLLNQNIASANEEFAEKKNKFDELLGQAEGIKQDIERTTDAIGGIFGVKPVEFASKKIGRFAYEKITGKKLKPEGEEKPTEKTAEPEQTETQTEFRPYQDTDPEPQGEASNPVTGDEPSLRSQVADQLEDINESDLASAIRGGSTERSVIEDAYNTLRDSGVEEGEQTARDMLQARQQAMARRTETEDQPQEEQYQVDRPAGQPSDEPAGAGAEAGAESGEVEGGISETAFGSEGATTAEVLGETSAEIGGEVAAESSLLADPFTALFGLIAMAVTIGTGIAGADAVKTPAVPKVKIPNASTQFGF